MCTRAAAIFFDVSACGVTHNESALVWYFRYADWPLAIQTIVKDELIRAVGDADKFVRNTVGIVVTHILAMSGGLERWKRLLPQLVSMLDPKVPDNAVDGAFRTLLKL